MPLGHGIAGGVALSGLPLAVTAAGTDSRWAKDIGERVGYVPDSIICVPLFYEDRVIGALELLDKVGAPSFTPADLNTLSLFAHQAAVTIEQSRTRLLGERAARGRRSGPTAPTRERLGDADRARPRASRLARARAARARGRARRATASSPRAARSSAPSRATRGPSR